MTTTVALTGQGGDGASRERHVQRGGRMGSELDFDGDSIALAVADHVTWELEIELKWSHPAAVETPKRAPGRSRGEDAG
jgi:hypothetical protein